MSKYYKPRGDILMAAIDWLMNRKKVLAKWQSFADRHNLDREEFLTEHGRVVGLGYEPENIPLDFEALLALLPALPNEFDLGRAIGTVQATALTNIQGGMLIKMPKDRELVGYTPLTISELASRYDIHICDSACKECGLMLAKDEKVCGRCGRCGQEVHSG